MMMVSAAGAEVLQLDDEVQELKRDRARLLVACIKAWDELATRCPDHPLVADLDALADEMMEKVCAGNDCPEGRLKYQAD